MDITEIRMKRKLLEIGLSKMLEEFEQDTNTKIESVFVDAAGTKPRETDGIISRILIIHVYLENPL
jgi:hypothetical protein